MSQVFQIIVDALIRTAELSLLAVGLTMVYGVLRFANFAHVEFATVGAYLALALSPVIGLPAAALVAILLIGLFGVGTDRVIFKRLRGAPPVMVMIASFALGIVLREMIRAIWGPSGYFYELGILPPIRFWGLSITPTQIAVIVAAALAMLAFHILLSRTRLGIAMRATADDPALAKASGANSDRIIAAVWFIGSAFAALGGVLIGLNTQLKADIGVGLIVEAFAAAIVGGIGNPYGAVLGAALIGFAENVGLAINWGPLLQSLGFNASGFVFIPTGYKAAIPFVLMIATLLVRPQGILGGAAMTEFLIYLATTAGISGILSLSLNVQYGMAGLVNLGHVGFFMLGAYVSAIMVVVLHQPIIFGIVAGVIAAALFGALMALPTARLQQDYWGISTLAAAEILRLFFLNTTFGSPYVGQAFGIDRIPRPFRESFATLADFNLFYMALTLSVMGIVLLFVLWLARTPFGRTLKAIREGDDVPLALGKRVPFFKLRAMAIGGGLGGLAGALFAHFNVSFNPEYFYPVETFIIWSMVILGGAGNFFGAIVGTFIIMAIYTSTRFLPSLDVNAIVDIGPIHAIIHLAGGPLRMVAIGILIILIILYLPRGLVPERRRRYDR